MLVLWPRSARASAASAGSAPASPRCSMANSRALEDIGPRRISSACRKRARADALSGGLVGGSDIGRTLLQSSSVWERKSPSALLRSDVGRRQALIWRVWPGAGVTTIAARRCRVPSWTRAMFGAIRRARDQALRSWERAETLKRGAPIGGRPPAAILRKRPRSCQDVPPAVKTASTVPCSSRALWNRSDTAPSPISRPITSVVKLISSSRWLCSPTSAATVSTWASSASMVMPPSASATRRASGGSLCCMFTAYGWCRIASYAR